MKSRLTNHFVAGVFAVASAFGLAASPAVAQDAAAPLSGHVTLWGGANLTSAAQIVLEGFSKEHPDVSLSYEKFPFKEYPTKMRLQLSTGADTPDVMIVHDFLVDAFIKAGWLADLSSVVSPDAFLVGALDNVTVDGKIYGIPGQSNPTGLWYRSDIFKMLPEDRDRYRLARSIYRSIDRDLIFVTDLRFKMQKVWHENAQIVEEARRLLPSDDQLTIIIDHLVSRPKSTLGACAAAIGSPVHGPRSLMALMLRRVVRIDLNTPLGPGSAIELRPDYAANLHNLRTSRTLLNV